MNEERDAGINVEVGFSTVLLVCALILLTTGIRSCTELRHAGKSVLGTEEPSSMQGIAESMAASVEEFRQMRRETDE